MVAGQASPPSMPGEVSRRHRRAGLGESAWARFAARRTAQLVVSVWILITATFLMIHMIPGDPVRSALGITASVDLVEATREALGLNDPLFTQYVSYVTRLFRGDMGVSMVTGLPVADVVAQRLPATLSIAVPAFLVGVVLAIPLGVTMSVLTRRGRGARLDLMFTSTSVTLGTIPSIIVAIVLVYIFSVTLGWLPVAGRNGLDSYILPVISLAIGPAMILARISKVEMASVLGTDYVRTARAKRLSAARVYLRHALPNAVTSSLTVGGLLLGFLIAGTVLIENVFAWPGLGPTLVRSILTKDYPMAQATVLVYGLIVLVINLGVDVILALIDPRSTISDT